MSHLYHYKPPNLEGSILYPLNELKTFKPHIYEKAAKKYKGREVLLKRRIPILDCLWNDVIHFSPVHPSKTFSELDKLYGKKFLKKPLNFFEVSPTAMDFNNKNTVIYLHTPREKGDFNIPVSDFVPFNAELLPQYQEIPDATLQHFHEAITNKRRVFLQIFVPHILYKGSLDINTLKEIEVY